MSNKGGLGVRLWALLVAALMLGSAFGGFKWAEATLPTQDGTWGQWLRDAYVYVSTALHLNYGTAGNLLYLDGGKNVTSSTIGVGSGDDLLNVDDLTVANLTLTGPLNADGRDTTSVDDLNVTDIFAAGDFWIHNGTAYENVTDSLIYPESEASFTVWVDGATYYARNGHTGAVTSNAAAYTLISPLIASNTHFFFKVGTYNFTTKLLLDTINHVIIDGEKGAILKASSDNVVLDIRDSAHILIKNIKIDGAGATNENVVYIHDCVDVSLEHIEVTNASDNGIYAYAVGSGGTTLYLYDVYVTNSTNRGIYVDGWTGLSLINVVAEIINTDWYQAINIINSQDVYLSNIWCESLKHYGINLAVSSNIILNVATIKGSLEDAITIDRCSGVSLSGIHTESTTRYSINVLTGSNTTSILGGNLDKTIMDMGTRTKIINCPTYVTESSGTATILNTTTSIVINHGLSYTPSSSNTTWSVSYLENPTNDPGSWYIDTFTATQTTIHVLRDPGASNLDIAWSAQRVP